MKMQSLNFQARPWHVDQMQCFHAFERMSTQFQFQPSPMVAGVWRLHRWGLDKAGIVRWIEETLDLGITTFDHADVYGGYTVEALFGQALKASPGLRHRLQIVTKCGVKIVLPSVPRTQSSPTTARMLIW